MALPKVVLYIAMSLDGYIASEDGSVEWLHDVEGDGYDNGYEAFYNQIGAVVMGRKTYDVVVSFKGDFPYADKPCYVVTRSSKHEDQHAAFWNGPVEELIHGLKKESDGNIWLVGGGQLVKEFLHHKLINRIELAIIPKILGNGIPLFPNGSFPSDFRLTEVEKMNQIAFLRYSTN